MSTRRSAVMIEFGLSASSSVELFAASAAAVACSAAGSCAAS
jgi:hypothetical protein